jgi:CheY-like chemotaxis protein
MPHYKEQRILLVEDSDVQAETLVRRMEEAGYRVTRAETFEEALACLHTGYFHLAVIDICLDLSQGESRQGLELLQEIKQMGLCELLPVIVITQYGDYSLMKRLHEIADNYLYVEKESGYIAKLLTQIHQVFTNKIPINFDLEFLANSAQQLERCIEYIKQTDDTQIPRDVLLPQVFDLIRKMFRDAKNVMLDRVAEGLSGAAVLRARPTYSQGLPRPVVIKIGLRNKVEREAQNYQKHVRLFLTGNCTTQLDAFYTRDLGGLLYTLNLAGESKNLKEFFESKSASEIVRALTHLFKETCAPWYRSHKAARYANLRDSYLEAFDLKDKPQRIPSEIQALHPEIDWTAPRVTLAPLIGEYPNPLMWLKDERAAWMPVATCITHGDLHADNILINEHGECWLIDFYRTYPSHILRDFVILETDLKYRLMGEITPSDFVTFESALIDWQPHQTFSLPQALPPRVRKTGEVIAGLRTQAWSLLNLQPIKDAQREYLASLLMATLNVLRLRHMKSPALAPRRELALLSTLLLCERLERLGPA